MSSINKNDVFETWNSEILKSLHDLVDLTNFLKTEDYIYNKTITPKVYSHTLKSISNDLTSSINQSIYSINNQLNSITNKETFTSAKQISTKYSNVIDSTDGLLEKIDTSIDSLKSALKSNSSSNNSNNVNNIPISHDKDVVDIKKDVTHSTTIQSYKPQKSFRIKVDNSNSTKWIPKLKAKPNAIVQLDIKSNFNNNNPYEVEINSLFKNNSYPNFLFTNTKEILYLPLSSTPLTFINTVDQLNDLATVLDEQSIIAIDLEHHSYRSYLGFTCLMQISTRTEDFIVDTILLRDDLQCLNSSFTNPNIVKVLHGANMDIIWLQRDLGLYLVNMFDTFQASKTLGLPRHSLAFLLEQYCQVTADKKHQLADWRIRPLSKEMIEYARSDTHYLLYIFDRMKNQLLNLSNNSGINIENVTNDPEIKNCKGTIQVLKNSEQVCIKTFEKPEYDLANGEGPGGWRLLLQKLGGGSKSTLNYIQLEIFKTLHQWRDEMARILDESTAFVLPNHLLFCLAQYMPETTIDIFNRCKPRVPIVIQQNINELAKLIVTTIKVAKEDEIKLQSQYQLLQESFKKRERDWLNKCSKGGVHIRFSENDNNDDVDDQDEEIINDEEIAIKSDKQISNSYSHDYNDVTINEEFPLKSNIKATIIESDKTNGKKLINLDIRAPIYKPNKRNSSTYDQDEDNSKNKKKNIIINSSVKPKSKFGSMF